MHAKIKYGLSMDETTDVAGHYVVNVIIGTQEINSPGKIFLLNSEVSDKVSYATNPTISRLFDKSLIIYCGPKEMGVKIFCYINMVKAGKSLKIFYPKMEHITCVAHIMYLVCEEIKLQFPKVNKLFSNMKQYF